MAEEGVQKTQSLEGGNPSPSAFNTRLLWLIVQLSWLHFRAAGEEFWTERLGTQDFEGISYPSPLEEEESGNCGKSVASPSDLPERREIPEVGVEGFAIQLPQDPPRCPQGQKCTVKQAGSHWGGKGRGGSGSPWSVTGCIQKAGIKGEK